LAIAYITNNKLDFKKWDKCITKAFNGNIYAYSWYLNIAGGQWNALVENDYEKVMPLPESKFAGYDIITQPKLAGPLGIFSTTTLSADVINGFLNKVPANYKYLKIKLNKHNYIDSKIKTHDKKISFDLDLIKPYGKLREKYPPLFVNLLDNTKGHALRIAPSISIENIIQFQQHHYPVQAFLHQGELITRQLLVSTSMNNKMGQLCGAYSMDNELVAMAFFVWSHQKASLVFHMLNKTKEQLAALFFLIDDFIRNNSEKNLILHLELHRNSELVSLLEKVGAKKSENFYYYRNSLPWYLKPFVA